MYKNFKKILKKIEIDIYLKQYERASDLSNNLVSALFTIATGIIASTIIGLFMNINSMIEYETGQFYYYLMLYGIPILFVAILLLISSIIIIFLTTIYYGFKMIQIEEILSGELTNFGEKDNFIKISESKPLEKLYTKIFYPNLYKNGYTHKFLTTLFLITFITGLAMFIFFVIIISNTTLKNLNNYLFLLLNKIQNHNIFFCLIILITYYFITFIIIPRFYPHFYAKELYGKSKEDNSNNI